MDNQFNNTPNPTPVKTVKDFRLLAMNKRVSSDVESHFHPRILKHNPLRG